MPSIAFTDRSGHTEVLVGTEHESIATVLRRNRIPTASVIVFSDGRPISENALLAAGAEYEAEQIEGFDLAAIREKYSQLEAPVEPETAYVKRRLILSRSGAMRAETAGESVDSVLDYVERTVYETCERFQLLDRDSRVVVGLSGGVDSGALLLSLAELRRQLPGLEIVAVTFEDFDMKTSPTYEQARRVAELAQVEHVVAPAELADTLFNLNRPLNAVLPALMDTPDAHHAMYVDSHTTRRALEVVAEERDIACIAFGLHTSDLVAGLLNGFMTGYPSGSLPKRASGELTFIYPLAFLQKKELHLYYFEKTGGFARHTQPNPWEHYPVDRNFYYYLADALQDEWPGLELMLVTAQERASRMAGPMPWGECANCGSAYPQIPLTSILADECDVCRVLRRAGFLAAQPAAGAPTGP